MPTGATVAPQGAAILPTGATVAPQGAAILPAGAMLAPLGAVCGELATQGYCPTRPCWLGYSDLGVERPSLL